jgi:hypothetical protein
MQIIGKF